MRDAGTLRGGTPAEVAVVLGAAIRAGGEPSAALRRRVGHGVRLVLEGHAERLLLSGGIGRYAPSEAEVMHRLAVAAGVDAAQIVLEPRATTTLENARECARIIAAEGWRRIVVVTDSYHIPRALLAFRAYGIQAHGSAPAGARLAMPPWQWLFLHCREGAALPWYVARSTVVRLARRRHAW